MKSSTCFCRFVSAMETPATIVGEQKVKIKRNQCGRNAAGRVGTAKTNRPRGSNRIARAACSSLGGDSTSLEQQLQGHLNVARQTRAGDRSEVRVAEARVRRGEGRSVGEVKRLEAELKPHSLSRSELAVNRQFTPREGMHLQFRFETF